MSQQINLHNPQLLAQRQHFSAQSMVQSAVLLLAGLAAFYAYAHYQVGQLGKQLDDATRRRTAMQERLVRASEGISAQQLQQQLETETRQLELQLAMLNEQLQALASIGNTSGYSEYMRAFARQSVGGVWLTGFAIQGDAEQMRLSGASLAPELVPAYIKRLNRETSLRGKEFAALQMGQHQYETGKTGRAYLEFTLQSTEVSEGGK